MPSPEEQARQNIDALLAIAGTSMQDFKHVGVHAARAAMRECPTVSPSPASAGKGPGARATSVAHDASYALGTFQYRLRSMGPLVTEWFGFQLWHAQMAAIRNLDKLAIDNERRSVRNAKH